MDYNNFDEKTKTFMNKAMDIYSTICDMKIIQDVKQIGCEQKYHFKKMDKKILSLFIAGFMVNGKLKEILDEYEDIKLHDLLEFANINEKDINKLADDEYSSFYSKNFRLDMESIIQDQYLYEDINYITPEVIVCCLDGITTNGSDILNYYSKRYDLGTWFCDHPLFKALNNHTLIEGSISENVVPKNNSTRIGSGFIKKPLLGENYNFKTQEQSKNLFTNGSYDESIWLLLDEIQKKYIGQEQTVESLFYNIINNQQLAELSEIPNEQRSIIFLDGPTGTGKTAITREITDKLGIPFTSSSVTNYSSTGYVGGDITDTLKDLLKKTNGNVERAQRGIIVFDEFDKIAYSRSGGLEMKRAVQQQLLDFLGGGKYLIHTGNSIFNMNEVEFDTSKLTFVCLAALTDLRFQKTEKEQAIGFGENNSQCEESDYTITPQDLIGIGLERELVGRFNTYLHTNDYSKENLVRILKESTISPFVGFKLWIESRNKKLKIDNDVYDLIANQAYELNTGARSLQTVMNNIRTPFIKEVLRGTSDTIYLDTETVEKINGQTMGRKGRL